MRRTTKDTVHEEKLEKYAEKRNLFYMYHVCIQAIIKNEIW